LIFDLQIFDLKIFEMAFLIFEALEQIDQKQPRNTTSELSTCEKRLEEISPLEPLPLRIQFQTFCNQPTPTSARMITPNTMR
jgi:hypothetical protein